MNLRSSPHNKEMQFEKPLLYKKTRCESYIGSRTDLKPTNYSSKIMDERISRLDFDMSKRVTRKFKNRFQEGKKHHRNHSMPNFAEVFLSDSESGESESECLTIKEILKKVQDNEVRGILNSGKIRENFFIKEGSVNRINMEEEKTPDLPEGGKGISNILKIKGRLRNFSVL